MNPPRNHAPHRTFSSFTVKVLRRSSFHLLPTFLQISIGPSGYRTEMHQHHVQGRISMNPAMPWDFDWILRMMRRGPSLHARGSSSGNMSWLLGGNMIPKDVDEKINKHQGLWTLAGELGSPQICYAPHVARYVKPLSEAVLKALSMASTIHKVRLPKAPPPTALR